jgi:multicomponent Na+:H+ antiporter subunit A
VPGSLVGVPDRRARRRPHLLALVASYALLALAVAAVGGRLGARAFWLAALAPLATSLYAGVAATRLGDDGVWTESYEWAGALGLSIDLRLDGFSLLMVLLVGVVGVFVFGYAASYFHDGPGVARTAAVLLVFAGSMLGLVLADNVLLLFGFWELTSITSFLLIGTNDEQPAARASALHALLVTGGGGLALLGGLVLIGQAAGTYSLSAILADPPTGGTVTAGVVLVLVGAFTKSAQVPFHAWLPGAMAAPTPISAYLHSATMVKAGVFLIGRLAPTFAATVGPWRWMVLLAGGASLVLGGYRALRQHDIKLVLAYGTVSQLGLLVILFGIGTEEATLAGCVLLLAHAAFKASLFLTVGIVDHQTHTRDLRSLDGLGRRWPVVAGAATLAAASMAGIPPLFGFIAKEYAVHGLLEPGTPARAAVVAVVVVGSMLTVAYSARFVWGAFGPVDPRPGRQRPHVGADAAHPSAAFAAAPVALAGLGLVLGVAPMAANGLVGRALEALGFADAHAELHLWGGFTLALGLSAVVISGGVALFLARGPVERAQARVPRLPSAMGAYEKGLQGLLRGADRLTGVVQNGSLPVYLAVILITAVALPLLPLLSEGGPDQWPDLVDSPLQVVLGVVIVVAALAATATRRRFAAVLLLGAVGYAMVGLFVVQGAPDLALTQVLIETLGVVAFVLVLRHLPEGFRTSMAPARRLIPALIGVAVGLFMFLFMLTAASMRDPSLTADGAADAVAAGDARVSEELLARSEPEAHGRNIVNVVIVDFRGFDTLGEITVLVVAALGVVGLVRAGRRDPTGTAPDPGGDAPDDQGRTAAVPAEDTVTTPDGRATTVEAGGVG